MSRVLNPSHTIRFGDLVMVEDGANPPDDTGVVYVVQAQDTDWGNPAPVTVALLSLLRAGSLVAYDRTDNRQPVLRVTIQADDSDFLALGEKALQLECGKPNTLSWIPPDGAGEESVFDIVWSSMDLVLDDLEELRRQRTYLIRLQALPYARGRDLVVTPALGTGAPAYTVLDDGSALSGVGFAWAAKNGSDSAVVDTGRIKLTGTGGTMTKSLERTGAIDMDGDQYLVIDVSSTVTSVSSVQLHAYYGGQQQLPLVATTDLGGGVTRYFYFVSPLITINLKIAVEVTGNWNGLTGASFWVDQVQTADKLPFFGTARQKALSLVAGGSVRTSGSIQISHETDALGKVIVYTQPSGTGSQPPLLPWRASGSSRTADAACLSGGRNKIATASTYRVPVTLSPQGFTELWAWVRNANAATVVIYSAADSIMGSFAVGPQQTDNVAVTFVANVWQLVLLGTYHLPPSQLGPTGYVQITIQKDGGSAESPDLDEAYLFGTEAGNLTIVDCGTGTAVRGLGSNRLWVDAPSQDQPEGGIWQGTLADRSDAFHCGSLALPWDIHEFEPDGTSIFVADSGPLDVATALEHYPRFHTHVSRDT